MKRGAALIIATVLAGLLLALGVMLVKMVYNEQVTAVLLIDREKAYWLAKGGLTWARGQLTRNPGWYGTEERALGEGRYKVVREMGKPGLQAIGYKGKAVYVLEGAIK
ncbi:MAG: hypothetical protein WC529_02550 [Candidatus Margulisiibacteriota bacterium]